MAWQDQLRPASFRGVAFQVTTSNGTFGRRVVLHEYPMRDRPFVEDLGRKARALRLEAVLIGSDYMARRDALIAALEAPGSGRLVHPYFGELQVSLDESGAQVTESTDHGGMARISFGMVESGDLVFPLAQIATADAVASAATEAEVAAANAFATDFDVRQVPAFSFESALASANAALDQVEAVIQVLPALGRGRDLTWSDLAALRPQLPALLRQPLELARRLQKLYASLRGGDDARTASRALAQMADFVRRLPSLPTTTVTRQRERANQDALIAQVHGAAAIERAHGLNDVAFVDHDSAQSLRDDVIAQLDAVANLTPHDELFQALSNLRAATLRDQQQRTMSLVRLRTYTPAQTLPALVLAYDLYLDPSGEQAIVDNNALTRPGFVPGGQPVAVPGGV
ncbi:DNA circularization protein [Pseudoxanthomonas sp. UTMC 1351]|uniref:DNA circularization protein n=1 Tax=Pseudoxanthomonas sp. UTMC 1351 TaxID=2695853 RepID=UPI0034CE6E5C